MEGPNQNAQAQ
jgi:hypothetical protein